MGRGRGRGGRGVGEWDGRVENANDKKQIFVVTLSFIFCIDQGPSLADAFEYVMYGKIYRLEGDEGPGDSGKL